MISRTVSKQPEFLRGNRGISKTISRSLLRYRPCLTQRWEIWRALIIQFPIREILPCAGWVDIADILETRFICTPIDLAALALSDASTIDGPLDLKGDIALLWKSELRRGGNTLRETPLPNLYDWPI